MKKEIVLISNGDFRDPVDVVCWPKQEETLTHVEEAFQQLGATTRRGNPYSDDEGHGFITTQADGCRIFAELDPQAPVVIVLSSWAWAHHVASAAKTHEGPVLILGNFDGTWPGLVALLNHAATFETLGIKHSRIWTKSFAGDQPFMTNMRKWLESGEITYSEDHLSRLEDLNLPESEKQMGAKIGHSIKKHKRIMGQMDPGCMGMLNGVISPEKLAGIGMPLELLNQSDLLAEMSMVSESDARGALDWLKSKMVRFHWGDKEETDLTERQVIEQMKMYIAAGRIHSRYGLSSIGIPYQYGLVRSTSASDLAEGMLNNSDRPTIVDQTTGQIINEKRPIVHFNEGDVGSGVPQVLMHDILLDRGMSPETTLHDLRWGDEWEDKFVWVFEISGGAPPAHFGGWDKTTVYRQRPMYFPKGGGTCSGVSKAGPITWARFYESFGSIGMDIGTGEVLELPDEEVRRRLSNTSEEWPIANVAMAGYDRDAVMSTHRSNHITICYGNIVQDLASVAQAIGIDVRVAGAAREEFR